MFGVTSLSESKLITFSFSIKISRKTYIKRYLAINCKFSGQEILLAFFVNYLNQILLNIIQRGGDRATKFFFGKSIFLKKPHFLSETKLYFLFKSNLMAILRSEQSHKKFKTKI